ncbi:MAG: hypothetical protein ABSG37_10570 [Candidatus Limnocylindrales bacterium]|jgi:hypothetical protein
MTVTRDVEELVQQALDALTTSTKIEPILERCIRIAELRRDYRNLWWLRMEATPWSKDRYRELDSAMRHYFSAEEYAALRQRFHTDQMALHSITIWNEKRQEFDDDQVSALTVGELEMRIEEMQGSIAHGAPPAGLHSLDLYYANESYQKMRIRNEMSISELRKILVRVRERLHRFLVETETAIVFGQTAANAFERTRRFVDGELSAIAPEILAEFRSAYERAEAGSPAAYSQALLSCRRVLLAVADLLYPPTGETVKGHDGVERWMTKEAYRNRLWQYIGEHESSKKTRKFVLDSIETLGQRLDDLDGLANRGVHDHVTAQDADRTIVQTYLLVGDLLRMRGDEGTATQSGASSAST